MIKQLAVTCGYKKMTGKLYASADAFYQHPFLGAGIFIALTHAEEAVQLHFYDYEKSE